MPGQEKQCGLQHSPCSPWSLLTSVLCGSGTNKVLKMNLSELLYYLFVFDYLLELIRLELWHIITPPTV